MSLCFFENNLMPLVIPPIDALKKTFALTNQEAKVAQYIAMGESVAEAAKGLGISYQTARNHLKFVMSKTYTHRQSELAILLIRVKINE